MPPAATKPLAQRKRNRKRKRRAASSSSSSSSSSDSSDDETPSTTTKTAAPATKTQPELSSSSSSSSSSSDSSDPDSSGEEEEEALKVDSTRGRPERSAPNAIRRFSPSPSPPPATLPSFLPPGDHTEPPSVQEQQLKDRFRQFWMSAVADGFKDDLEEIRKEPNLGTSRLALLIDSLAAGAEVFTSSNDDTSINEMDVVLN